MSRLYQPAWEALRDHTKVRIKLDDRKKIKRFIRGVSKEKNEDPKKLFNFSIVWRFIEDCEECKQDPKCVVVEMELRRVLKTRMSTLLKHAATKKEGEGK